MSSVRGFTDQNWSFHEIERIDSICDEFERMWNEGLSPSIEAVLANHPDLPRSHLLFELVRLERELLRGVSGSLKQDDYLCRFPQDQETIALIWQQGSIMSAYGLPPTESMAEPPPPSKPQPEQLGRFKILRTLGEGGFGVVYLAHDPARGHDIALKIPHPHLLQSPQRRAELMGDHIGQKLDHPHLVKTLGIEEDGEQLFVVLQFIDGSNLAEWHNHNRPTPHQVVELVIQVAQALAYLHEQGYTHRDLKPANILIDKDQRVYVADFGLTLHEDEQRRHKGQIAGTWPYMSPEQIRREAHLVDGQSDIWSVGVILYMLFTDRLPFGGPPPRRNGADYSAYIRDLEKEIPDHDPKPPRMIRPELSRKLEEICLRCLEKRKRDRYQTALDLAEDLRLYLEKSVDGSRATALPRTIRIVPKGLRSFDAADAEFFVELLPGPRTSSGLPSSINFWRNRLSGARGTNPIDVGVIYGPSGCGKSSLVKAGLLPILGHKFVPLIVEATAEDTEVRLLKALRQAVPGLPAGDSLVEVCRRIGDRGAGGGRKILLVFDQFEQWLHSHPDVSQTQFLAGLRYCNGMRMQALFLVRDDFWMPLTRFVEQLEIPLHENNSAAVDLFNGDHAREVLAAFGRAYGRLQVDGELTAGQELFLERAIEGLADDGRIICVRLALFAEMMKDRPWTPEELTAVGGAKGIGVAFLEQKLGRNAPAVYRPHCAAAERVLERLLPPYGSDLKGQMRTANELREAAGYDTTRAFDQLIQILNSELKLLTPIASDNPDGSPEATSDQPPSYQLTHDYLVPSLREWITRKKRETWRGRAELQLADRASFWNARRESKQLPSAWEAFKIWMLTRSGTWTDGQRRMMRAAARIHLARLTVLATAFGVATIAALLFTSHLAELDRRQEADQFLETVLVADLHSLPDVLSSAPSDTELWYTKLRSIANDPQRDADERLRANLIMIRTEPKSVAYVIGSIRDADIQDLSLLCELLRPREQEARTQLWEAMREASLPDSVLLRLASGLALYDADSRHWLSVTDRVVQSLVTANQLEVGDWTRAIEPAAKWLIQPLERHFHDAKAPQSTRVIAAGILARFAADSPERLAAWTVQADTEQFPLMFAALATHGDLAVNQLHDYLPGQDRTETAPPVAVQARAGIALILLDRGEAVWPLLRQSENPELRTTLIALAKTYGVQSATLKDEFVQLHPASIKSALLLALGEFELDPADPLTTEIADVVSHAYQDDPDSGVHSAAEWLLRKWKGTAPELSRHNELDRDRTSGWWVNSQGQTMIVLPRSPSFMIGSPAAELQRDPVETLVQKPIDYSFAISAHEITIEQFVRFDPKFGYARDIGLELTCPINKTNWFDAIRYCRWLSEQESVPEDQMCYPSLQRIAEIEKQVDRNVQLDIEQELPGVPDSRSGYRLPTEAEWEYAARAGARSRWCFGEDPTWLPDYASYLFNADERTWPVGTLRPNAFGLFDAHGNVQEWCHSLSEGVASSDEIASALGSGADVRPFERLVRGGHYRAMTKLTRSAKRFSYPPRTRVSVLGFRIVKTVRE